MKASSCNGASHGAKTLAWFLGVLLLGTGVKFFLSYGASVEWIFGITNRIGGFPASVTPLINGIGQVVAYSWPVASVVIGLSFLTCFKKCWATLLLAVYLTIFALAHLWSMDLQGAMLDFLVMLALMQMKGLSALGKMMA